VITHEKLAKANNEVVAFLVDGYITNNLMAIIQLINHCNHFEYVTRARAAFMAACDLGKVWKDLANAPVLFGLDDKNNPIFIEGGLLKPKDLKK
jgi:hypothetical protein